MNKLDEIRHKMQKMDTYIEKNGCNNMVMQEYVKLAIYALQPPLPKAYMKFALTVSKRAKEVMEQYAAVQYKGNISRIERYCQENNITDDLIDKWYLILLAEAPIFLDSYCLYVEKNRPKKERFYEPRRDKLLQAVEAIQELEDDELDELYLHQPPRTGKSGLVTFATSWHISKNTELSNLYVTYKESLGGAFLTGVCEIMTDPTYCHMDVFPLSKIVSSDSKSHKIDIERHKKYQSLSGKGLESGLNGEYDASGWLIIDDPLEGIQDVLNPETLRRKQIIFDNNVISRKKEKAKILNIGTIWSLHDIYSDRMDFLSNSPQAAHIRWKVVKLPALNEHDESNFDYKYGVGFTTEYYRQLRSKFEENNDIASWLAQYQQEPIERDGAVFNSADLKYYNGVLPPGEPWRICAACDVALGGEDFLSFPVAYMYEDGSVYIHDVVFDDREKRFTKPEVIDAIVRNNVGSALFEANQGGEGYKDEVNEELKKMGIKLNLRSEYAPSGKRKEQRIWDKAGSIRDFYFRDNTCRDPQYRKFMSNLLAFTMVHSKRKHDDAADSLATLAYFIEGTWNTANIEAVFNPFRSRWR